MNESNNETWRYELESARNLNMAARIVAIVSLFLGGVIASTVAVVLAAVSYRKITTLREHIQDEATNEALKRSGIGAIVVSVIALALNAISLALLMPTIVYIVQTGDYSSLFGSAVPVPQTGTSSTWG